MDDFNTRKVFITPSFELDLKKREKLDRFLKLLDDSGVRAELFGAKAKIGYVRFRRISLEKANLEFSLTALGRNIRKYFRFLEGRSTFTYWTAPEGLVAEEMKKPSAKRLCRRVMRIRKKEPNEKAKSEHRSKYKTKKGGVLLRANPPRIS